MYLTKYNILLVDDRPENLITLEGILESPELEIFTANSGNEALGILLEHDFALVLMDVQMPGMDGFETAEIMRSNKRTKQIPIIFVTAISKQRKHIFKGYQTGAIDYLYKPLDLEILKSKVKAFIEFFKHRSELQDTTKKLLATVKELEHAKNIAVNATNTKSLFLASMSHEIRTPLNGIIGMADLGLLDSDISELQKERLEDIKNSGETLLEIINDILDISKVEADSLELEEIEFSLGELVARIFNTISIKAIEGQNELICDIDSEIPDMIIGDPLRLRQILINLLNNAIKFTEEGVVKLSIVLIDYIEEQVRLEFCVTDTGVGISDDDIERLFDTYTQADASTTRTHGGTGLGLNISQKLAKLMGGNITAKSKINKGSSFMFTLNFIAGIQPEEDSTTKDLIKRDNYKILIVDNNKEAALVLSKILSVCGLKNKISLSFQETVSILNKENFDMLFIDFMLNGMTGDEIVDKLNTQFPENNFDIVFLSQIKSSIEVNKLQKTKNYDFITKPLLRTKIKAYFDNKYWVLLGDKMEDKDAETKPVEHPETKSVRILIAEDQIINMKIVTQLLQKKGWEVIATANGKLALEAFKMNQGNLNIILMDIQMPEMDGFSTTEQIRKLEKDSGSHIPIVAMTALAMKGDKEKCFAAGMDYYLSKPINPNQLYAIVEKYTDCKS
ncbi:MAG: response regulator [Bacteroidetes bacterium]|nr:response regulator [Bacteroidota bacterium]MBL6943716.1 response regulator [Bacteroidales bacterium]